jgi:hypothetical protein
MSKTQEVWWRPGGRSPFALDPAKPRLRQIISNINQSLIIFGGPAIGMVAMKYYPLLIEDRTIFIGGFAGIAFWFAASFAIFSKEFFPPGIPPMPKLLFRAGFGLCTTFLVFGLFGIANGYGTPLIGRDVAVVAKRTSLQNDPDKRSYYMEVRARPASRAVVELDVSRAAYERLRVPVTKVHAPQPELDDMRDSTTTVRLTVGEGRFGVEWFKGLELTQ